MALLGKCRGVEECWLNQLGSQRCLCLFGILLASLSRRDELGRNPKRGDFFLRRPPGFDRHTFSTHSFIPALSIHPFGWECTRTPGRKFSFGKVFGLKITMGFSLVPSVNRQWTHSACALQSIGEACLLTWATAAVAAFVLWHTLQFLDLLSPVAHQLFTDTKFTACCAVVWLLCELADLQLKLSGIFHTFWRHSLKLGNRWEITWLRPC